MLDSVLAGWPGRAASPVAALTKKVVWARTYTPQEGESMHCKVAAALVAALALWVAGCGGSETTTLSRAELVRRVELACREGQREVEKRARASRGRGDQSDFINAIAAGQEIVMDQIDDLDASGAAKADFQAFKDGVQARLDGIKRVAEVDRADQPRAIRAAQPAVQAASRRAQAAARSLGIDGCM
jgi:hypothetical protein